MAKVFIVLPQGGEDGYGAPIAAFDSRAAAEAEIKHIDQRVGYSGSLVIELELNASSVTGKTSE